MALRLKIGAGSKQTQTDLKVMVPILTHFNIEFYLINSEILFWFDVWIYFEETKHWLPSNLPSNGLGRSTKPGNPPIILADQM